MENPSWPAFLGLLDSDPDRAFSEFYRFTSVLLTKKPPPAMRTLCSEEEDSRDLIHDFIYRCVRDGFRVLRKYRDEGKTFACWLYTIAGNFFWDKLREKRRKPKTISIERDPKAQGLKDSGPGPAKELEQKELEEIGRKTIARMDEYCRLLLVLRHERGLKPKEIVKLLGLPSDQNKNVSDDLRYCWQKLKKLLGQAGVDVVS